MKTLPERYRKIRAEHPGLSARTCLTWARSTPKALDWEHGRGRELQRAEWRESGFRIVATIEYDETGCGVDWLGEFHDKPTRGSISVQAPRSWRETFTHYVPANSYADHYKALRKDHSRQEAHELARKYVLADAERLRQYADGDLSLLGCVVKVYRGEIRLGCSSVWGIDVDSLADPYLSEVARDIAPDAISEAQRTLATICASNE